MYGSVFFSFAVCASLVLAACADVNVAVPADGEKSVVTVDPKGTDTVTVRLATPISDIQQMWRPTDRLPFQDRKWWISFETAPQMDMPYLAFFNMTEENRFSLGSASLEWDSRIVSKINQEKGVYEIALTVAAGPDGKLRPFALTLDRRHRPWTDVLADWRTSLGYAKGGYPDAAWKGVYCSWYAAHAAISQDWVERTAAIAADLGFGTFILDDGWSYDESKRVNPETIKTWYRDVGRWDSFSKAKFPDFKAHRERMRKLGLKYIVWVAPYFIGTRTPAFSHWGFDRDPNAKPFEGNVLADLRNGPMMDSVTEQLVRLLKETDLDGLKIDFLDYILPSVDKPRGATSLAYIERLMRELRAVKPDGIFEFRQSYATPVTAHLATQFRAGDVPFEWLANLQRIAQIRLAMGDGVPIHADPIYWSDTETDDNVNRHFMAAMAGVPMLSMDLEKMPAARRETVRRWMKFYAERVEKFQRKGHWEIRYHNGGLAWVASLLGDEALVIVNDASQFPEALKLIGARHPTVLNLSSETSEIGGIMQRNVAAPEFSAKDVTEAREWKSPAGTVFRYRWHAPAKVEPGKKYPLVILLHGAGERGTNNVAQLVWGAKELLAYATKNGDCYFVAGQVPNGRRWVEVDWSSLDHRMPAEPSETMAAQIAFLEKTFADESLAVDPDRVYVTGISMGGYGTWDLAMRRPEWFAAAMPICGGGDVCEAWRVRHLPIRVFHGDCDTIVPFERSRRMSTALWAVDGDFKYTEYPGVGHGVWGPVYGNEGNLKWLFSNRRKARARFPFSTGMKVAFLGDSITQLGTEKDYGYVNGVVRALAAKGAKVEPVYAGISGNMSNHMLSRLEKDVLSKKPQVMFLSCGVNDAPNGCKGESFNPGIPLADYEKNMAEIVRRAQEAGITVILLEPTPVLEEPHVANVNERAYVEACRALGRREKLTTVPLNRIFTAVYGSKPNPFDRIYTVDGTHLNAVGYRIMTDVIIEELGWK